MIVDMKKIIEKEAKKPRRLVNAVIQWRDTEEEEEVTIARRMYIPSVDDQWDDEVFFYCENQEDFSYLLREDNGEDFRILSYEEE